MLAKLVDVGYRPEWRGIILLLVFSTSMMLVLISELTGKTVKSLTPMLTLPISVTAVGSAVLAIWLWRLRLRLSKALRELSEILRVRMTG